MFDNATVEAVAAIAARLNVEPAALLAVAEVESGGKAFARVGGRDEPLIRWEGHYFDRRLSGTKRAAARKAGLASPKAGGVPNPAKQEDRWKLLNRAAEIDVKAAFESASYGIPQVMGAHWKDLGYASVTDLVNVLRSGVEGQIEVMARFIEKNKLAAALRKRDWAAFARGYNGAGYAKNAYDKKMAAAYGRWAKRSVAASAKNEPEPAAPNAMLKRGDTGKYVEDLQRNLIALGYSLTATGTFDDRTEAAVEAFQSKHGLLVDGKAGIRTNTKIGEEIAAMVLEPKIDEAKKNIPPTADKAVKEETTWFNKIIGWFTGGGLLTAFGIGNWSEAEWTTILAMAGGVVLVGGAAVGGFLLLGNRVAAKFDEINARARQ